MVSFWISLGEQRCRACPLLLKLKVRATLNRIHKHTNTYRRETNVLNFKLLWICVHLILSLKMRSSPIFYWIADINRYDNTFSIENKLTLLSRIYRRTVAVPDLMSGNGRKSLSSSGFRLGRLNAMMWPLATYTARHTLSTHTYTQAYIVFTYTHTVT